MKITRHTRREHSSRLTSTVVGHSVSMETSGMTNQRLTYKIKAGTSQTPKRRAVTAPTVCLFTRATFRRVRSLAPTASQRACSRWHSTQSVLQLQIQTHQCLSSGIRNKKSIQNEWCVFNLIHIFTIFFIILNILRFIINISMFFNVITLLNPKFRIQ